VCLACVLRRASHRARVSAVFLACVSQIVARSVAHCRRVESAPMSNGLRLKVAHSFLDVSRNLPHLVA
jgi:hypothetical protein